jgi:hypothetical protein
MWIVVVGELWPARRPLTPEDFSHNCVCQVLQIGALLDHTVSSHPAERPSPTSVPPERRTARKGAPSGAAELHLRASTVLASLRSATGGLAG